MRQRISATAATALAVTLATMAGCSKTQVPDAKTGVEKSTKAHDHSGWWCAEHGIPEEECSMCSAKVAAELKKTGDWCEKHDRAMSQCFVCNPKRQEYFAAKHQAKYGKAPPPLEEPLPREKAKEKVEPKEKS